MPVHTNVSIEIEGTRIPKFLKLELEQKVNDHHRFSIVLPVSFGNMPGALERAQSYVGGKLLLRIEPSHFSTGAALQFRGIVSETRLVKGEGASGTILVRGFSPTFQMDGMPDTMSFNDRKLSEIAAEIIGRYPQDRLDPKISLDQDDMLPYTVQYRESDFRFLSRMAAKKAVWFYYNGNELVFGKPDAGSIELVYGSGLSSFNIEMRTKPVNFSYHGYDASEAKNEAVTSEEVSPQLNTIAANLFQHSKKMFPWMAGMLYNNPIKEGALKEHLSSRINPKPSRRYPTC